jgi:hypothetical protein
MGQNRRQILEPITGPHGRKHIRIFHAFEVIWIEAAVLPVNDAGDQAGTIRLQSGKNVGWPQISVCEDDWRLIVTGKKFSKKSDVNWICVAIVHEQEVCEIGSIHDWFLAVSGRSSSIYTPSPESPPSGLSFIFG